MLDGPMLIIECGGPDASALVMELIQKSRDCQDEAVCCAGEESAW
jgi:hypothetical protein